MLVLSSNSGYILYRHKKELADVLVFVQCKYAKQECVRMMALYGLSVCSYVGYMLYTETGILYPCLLIKGIHFFSAVFKRSICFLPSTCLPDFHARNDACIVLLLPGFGTLAEVAVEVMCDLYMHACVEEGGDACNGEQLG